MVHGGDAMSGLQGGEQGSAASVGGEITCNEEYGS